MNPIIDKYGNKRWHNEHGQLHRSDGPAVIYSDGAQCWFINGKYNRLDGPALIYHNGEQHWFVSGKRHRTDGPAIIYPNGVKRYWIHGHKLTEEEYYDIIQSEEHLNWYLLQL